MIKEPGNRLKTGFPSCFHSRIGLSFILAFAAFLVFSNTIRSSFIWDDEQFVQKNAFLASFRYLPQLLTQNIVAGAGLKSNLYRPVQSATHLLDTRLWGSDAKGHHLSNVLIHCAASVAVFWLLAMWVSVLPAFLAAALFALHPIQSEAVAYVSGRGDTLSILFLSLCLILYEKRLWASLTCAFLAILSKESMALAPLYLLMSQWGRGRPVHLKRLLPCGLLAASYAFSRLTVLNFSNTLNFYGQSNVFTEHVSYRLFTYVTTLVKGLGLWIWPVDLHHERSWAVFGAFWIPQVWVSSSLILMIGAVLYRSRSVSRAFRVGGLWFLVATIPTSNLFVMINAIFYDHWFIFPGIGLALITAHLFARAERRGPKVWKWTLGAAGLLLCVLSVATVRYNRVWRDPLSLYTHILSFEDDSAKIHANLGMAYADLGQYERAIECYERSITLSDEYPQTHHNLANSYEALGDSGKALYELGRALHIDPTFYHSRVQMGMIYLKRGEWDKARDAFTAARQVYPYAVNIYLGLAQIAIQHEKNPASAISLLEDGLGVLSEDPQLLSALQKLRSENDID